MSTIEYFHIQDYFLNYNYWICKFHGKYSLFFSEKCTINSKMRYTLHYKLVNFHCLLVNFIHFHNLFLKIMIKYEDILIVNSRNSIYAAYIFTIVIYMLFCRHVFPHVFSYGFCYQKNCYDFSNCLHAHA